MVRSQPFSSRPGGVLSFTFFFSLWSCNIYTTRSNFESSDVLVSGVPVSHFVYDVVSCISFNSFLFFVLFSFRKDLQAEAPADLRPTQGTVILHITFAAKQDQVGVLVLKFSFYTHCLDRWLFGKLLQNCATLRKAQSEDGNLACLTSLCAYFRVRLTG